MRLCTSLPAQPCVAEGRGHRTWESRMSTEALVEETGLVLVGHSRLSDNDRTILDAKELRLVLQ